MAISHQAKITPHNLAVVVSVSAQNVIVVHVDAATLASVLAAVVGALLTKTVALNGKTITVYPYI